MSGGKGGSSTTEVKIPEYIEEASKANLARANEISQIGYVPYYGPDVAAFSPMQQAAFQNTADTASAFGLSAPTSQQDIMGGMPAPTTYAGGVQGYSSAPMYEQSLAELKDKRPAQYKAIMDQFIDPVGGSSTRSSSGKGGGSVSRIPPVSPPANPSAMQIRYGGNPNIRFNSAGVMTGGFDYMDGPSR